MEYNKNRFQKVNDKKVLHKVKKQWVVLSLSMLALLGGGAAATKVSAHADVNSQNNHTMRLSAIRGQINHNLVKAYRASQANSAQSNSNRSNNSANSQLNVNAITQRAGELHNRIVNNAELNDLQKPSVGGANSENGRTKPNLNSASKPTVTNNGGKNQSAINSRISKPVNKVVTNNNQNNGANNKPKVNPVTKSTKATAKHRPDLKALRGSLRMSRPRRLLGAIPEIKFRPSVLSMEQGNPQYVWSDGRWGTAHVIANGNNHTIYVYGHGTNSDTVGQTYAAFGYYQAPGARYYGKKHYALAPNPSIFGNLFFQKEDQYGHLTNNLPESPDNHSKNDWSIDVYDVKAPVNASELFSGVGAQYFPDNNDIQTAIKSINVQGLDTSDTTDMSDMFDDVNGNSFDGYSNDNVLTSINGLGDLDTSKVTDFKNMFQNNANLTSLYLSNVNTLNANKTEKTNMIPENVNQLTLGPNTILASDSIANVKGPWGSTSTDANTPGNVNHQFWRNSDNTPGVTKLTDSQSHPGTWNWNNSYWTDGRWGNAHVTIDGYSDKIIVSDGKGPNGSDVGETKGSNGNYLSDGDPNFFANAYFPNENSSGHITKLPNDKKDWQIVIKSGKAPKNSSYLFSGTKTNYYKNSITPQIKSIDVSGLDTSKVTYMNDMFNDVNANSGDGRTNDSLLDSITGLDRLDTSKVSDFTDIFQNDPGLNYLDLNNWDTTHATKKANMIPENVTKLTLGNHTILADNSIANVKNGWDSASDDVGTDNNGDHQYWKQNSNDSKYTRLTNNQSHPGTWIWKDARAYWTGGRWGHASVLIDGYSDKIIVSDNKGQQNGSDIGETFNNGVSLSPNNPNFFANVFFPDKDSYGHLTFLPNKNRDWQIVVKKGVNAPSNSSYLFSGPHAYWFKNGAYITPQIKSIDVSGLNTANVTNMESMFNDVNAIASDNSDNTKTLTSITGLSDWDTSKVTDFVDMFQNNPKLTSLDLSNWDTTNAPTSDKTNYSHVNWNSLYNADNRINMIPTNVTQLTLGPKTELAWNSIADVVAKRTPAYAYDKNTKKSDIPVYEYDPETGRSDIRKMTSFWNSGYLNDSNANPEEQPNNGNHWWWHDNRGNYANLTQETSNPGTWTWDTSTPIGKFIWGDATVNIDPSTDTIYIDKGSTGGMYNSSDNKTPESKWSDHDNIFDNIRHVSDPSKIYSTLPGNNNDWKIVMNGTRIIQDHSSASDLFNSDGSSMADRIQSIDLGNGNDKSAIRLDPNVNGFNRTFNGMKNVNQINLSGLNMANVGYLSYFMSSDPSLTNVNLTGLNLVNTQYIHHLFANDTALESANLSNLRNQPSVGYSSNDIFTNDNKLKRLAISPSAIFRSSNSGNPQAWGIFFNPDATDHVANAKGDLVDIKSLIENGSEGTGSDRNNPLDRNGDYEYYLVSNLPVYWAPNLSDDTTIPNNMPSNQYGQYYDRTGMKYPASAYKDTKNVRTSPIVVLKTANQKSTGGSISDNFGGYQGNKYNSTDISLESIKVSPSGEVNKSDAKAPAGYTIANQIYSDKSDNGDYYVYADLNGLPVTGNVDYYTSDGEGDNHIIAQDDIKSDHPAYVGRRRSLRDINQILYRGSSDTIKGYHVVHDGQSIDSDSNNLNQTIHSELTPGRNMLDNLGQWIKPFHVKIAGNYEEVPIEFINGNKQQNEKFATQGNVNFAAYVTIPTDTNPTITQLRHDMQSVLKSISDYKGNTGLTASDKTYWNNLNTLVKNNSKISSNVKSELQHVIDSINNGQKLSSDESNVFKDIGYGEVKRYQASIYNDISNSSDYDYIYPQNANERFPTGPKSSDNLTTGSIYSLDYSDVNNWVQNNDPTYTLANQPILSTLSDTSHSMNPNGYDTINDLMKDSKYMGKINVKTGKVNPIIYVVKSAKENVTYNYINKNTGVTVSHIQIVSAVGNNAPIPSDTNSANANGLVYGYTLLTKPSDYSYGSTPFTGTDGKRYIKVSLRQAHTGKDPNVINMYVTPNTEHIPINYVNDQNSGETVKSFNIDGIDKSDYYDGNKSTDTPLYPNKNTKVKITSQQLQSMIPKGYVLDKNYYPSGLSDQEFFIVGGNLPGDIKSGNIQDNSGYTVPLDVHIVPSPKPSDQYLTVNYIDQAGDVISSQKSKYNIIPIQQPNKTYRYSDQPLDITKIPNSEYNKLVNSDKYVPEKDQQLVIPYGTPSVNIYLTGPKEVAQAPITIRFLDANGREIQSDQYTHVALNGHAGDTGVIFNTTNDFTYNVPAGYKLQNPNENYQASITSEKPYYKWNSDYAGTGRSTDWDSVHDQPLLLYKNNNVCISSLILRYVNQDGHQVGNTDIINQNVGTKVDVTNPNDGGESVPEGYQLAKTPYNQPVTYTVNNKDKVITLKVVGNQVTKPFTVTTESKGVDGNLLIKNYPGQEISGRIGDDITVNPEDYRLSSNYNCDSDDYGHSIHIDSDGSLTPDQLTFKYYENPDKAAAGNVIVHYINQKGRQVGNTFTINAAVNHYHTGQFVSDIAEATGYEAVPDGYAISNPDSDATTITDQPQTMNIQVKGDQLTKSDSAVVIHRRIKQLNGTFMPLSDRTLSLSGDQYGDSDTIDPYDYVPSSETGVQYIVDSDDHTDSFVINPHQPVPPITFTYDPFGVSKITVHYVDDSNSDQEIDQESDVGVVGDDFDIAPYMNDIPEGYQYNNQVTGSGSSLINPNEAIQFTGDSKDIYVHVKSNQDYPNDQPNDQSHHDWNGLNGSNGTGINPNND